CPTNSVVEHISNVLEIASIFNAQESTLKQVSPLTLEGIVKRWFERTLTECTKRWNDLKQNFIQRFCPPAMIFKQLSEIQNFKQEEGESLFDTWERYNDLLFKCPFHDLNDHQKVNTFYNGLNSQTRRTADSNGLIPGLTALDALKSIQKLVKHSHKWHCEENHMITINPLRVITEKLKLLNHEMEELKLDFRKLNTGDDKKGYYVEVKRRILEENKEPTTTHDKLKQQLQKVVSHEIKELPAHYSATFQNKLPLKETDPRSFILPCIIENHFMSNALADLEASISVMPYSLFKRLGLGSLKPIKMTIEMADRSMQSPKGIKQNVLVKISNFMFPVDFAILDIMEDENILIILGRPMLVTTHAKIDVYGSQDIISLSPSESAEVKEDFSMKLCDPDKRMSIGLEEFVDIDDMWDDPDPRILTNEKAKTEFLKSGGEMQENDKKQGKKGVKCLILINRGLIQAILTSLPPQPIKEAIKASNLQRIPPGVQGRSHFI
ncbi:hypothetical protein Tco_0547452, partial [Tanacetum coccineum]